MFKKISLFLSFFVLIFVSCANELIPEQTVETITSGEVANQELLAPTELKISQGNVKSVNLSWKLTKNAVRYKIYSTSVNPPKPSDFELVREINENPFVEISENAGVSKWYYVTAVNIEGKESNPSSYVYGTTLATPLITAIDEDDSGTKATVYWYLDNCFDGNSLYINDVNFSVYVYDSEKKEIRCEELVGKKFIPETKDEIVKYSYTFENLSPKTLYYFEVVAYTSDKVKTEKSGKLDAETARKLMPLSVNNFYAEKGKSTKNINVVFNLPEFCDYQESSNEFSRHPLYFKLERKIKNENSEWTILAERISSCENSIPEKKVYKFNCAEDENTKPEYKNYSGDDFEIIVEKSTDTNSETSSNYLGYIADSKLTFIDKTAERGLLYVYRIRSYVDDSKKTITSDATILEDSGWMISYAEFGVGAEYDTQEENSVNVMKKVSISFKFNFNDYGLNSNYTYEIEEKFQGIKDYNDLSQLNDPVTKIILETKKISDVNKFIKEYIPVKNKDENGNEGYYQYELKIYDEIKNPEPYEILTVINKVIVLGQVELIPNVKDLKVEDGYSNSYNFTWTHAANATYELKWYSLNENNEKVSEDFVTLVSGDDESAIKADYEVYPDEPSKEIKFKLPANPDERRQFVLTVYSGLTVDVPLYDENNNLRVCETLGVAKPEIVEYDYDKITVKWNKVQQVNASVGADGVVSSGYEISAKYNDSSIIVNDAETDEIKRREITNLENCKITEEFDSVSNKTYYKCEIKNPYGYDNPQISGLPVDFTIKSSSSVDSTEVKKSVYTIGPALINTFVENNAVSSEKLQIKWNKVEGANGYLIQRVIYSDYRALTMEASDKYLYSVSDGKIITNGDDSDSEQIAIFATTSESGTVYTLEDKYSEPKKQDKYNEHQSKIAWGLPYSYVVIPLKNIDDQFEFKDGQNELLTLTDESRIPYCKNGKVLDKKTTATFGYAHNIIADKSTSGDTQKISWEKPYFSENVPNIYRRKIDASTNKPVSEDWVYVNKRNNSETINVDLPLIVIIPEDSNQESPEEPNYDIYSDTDEYSAFEYVIAYSKGFASPGSFIKVKDSYLKVLQNDLGDRYVLNHSEQKNKGYILYTNNEIHKIESVLTQDKTSQDYWAEKISWYDWDYDYRQIGPSGFKVLIQNNDISGKFVEVVTCPYDADVGQNENKDVYYDKTGLDNISVKVMPYKIAKLNGTNTTGNLKVLRDVRHYYNLKFYRTYKNESEEEIIVDDSNCFGSDNGLYGYRQITDEELAKAALLDLSYGFYIAAGGTEDYSNANNSFKYNGWKSALSGGNPKTIGTSTNNIWFDNTHYNLEWPGKYYSYYKLNNFLPSSHSIGSLEKKESLKSSFLLLSSDESECFAIKGADDNYIFRFEDENVIKVSLGNSLYSNLKCDATIKLYFYDDNDDVTKNTLKITIIRDGNTNELVNSVGEPEIRKCWLPMAFNDNRKFEITSPKYGWWPPYR